MPPFIYLVIAFLSWIVAIAWYLADLGFEPLLAFLAGLASLLKFIREREGRGTQRGGLSRVLVWILLGATLLGAVHVFEQQYRSRVAQSAAESGLLALFDGRYTWAISEFTDAIAADPNNAEYYFHRGRAYLLSARQGSIPPEASLGSLYDKAIADYTRAIQLDPTRAEYYYYRGVVYHLLSDYARAIGNFSHALELDPTVGDYYFARALASELSGQNQQAESDYGRAEELGYGLGTYLLETPPAVVIQRTPMPSATATLQVEAFTVAPSDLPGTPTPMFTRYITPTPTNAALITATEAKHAVLQNGAISSTYDLYMDELGLGQLEFTHPALMNLGDDAVVRLLISPSEALASLPTQTLTVPENNAPIMNTPVPIPTALTALIYDTAKARLPIFPIMRAELFASGFQIHSENPVIKDFSPPNPFVWNWLITAEEPGSRLLHVEISIPTVIDEEWAFIRSQTIQAVSVNVQVNITTTPTPVATISPDASDTPTSTTTPMQTQTTASGSSFAPTQTPSSMPTPTLTLSERATGALADNITEIIVAIIGIIGTVLAAYLTVRWQQGKEEDKVVKGKIPIVDLKAGPARRLISKTDNETILKRWREEEENAGGRSSIVAAIDEKLNQSKAE